MLVGQPVGDVLDTWSEGGNLVLPNSGLTVHYANGFHGYSTRDYPDRKPYFSELNLHDHALDPHVTLEPTFAEYRSRRGPPARRDPRLLVFPTVSHAPFSRVLFTPGYVAVP